MIDPILQPANGLQYLIDPILQPANGLQYLMALQPGLCGQLYMTLRLLASLVRTISLQQPGLGCLPGTTVRHLWGHSMLQCLQ
jgi:hypothetical protein